MYADAVRELDAAGDDVAAFGVELVGFVDGLSGSGWGEAVIAALRESELLVEEIVRRYGELGGRMRHEGGLGAAAHDQVPWAPDGLGGTEGSWAGTETSMPAAGYADDTVAEEIAEDSDTQPAAIAWPGHAATAGADRAAELDSFDMTPTAGGAFAAAAHDDGEASFGVVDEDGESHVTPTHQELTGLHRKLTGLLLDKNVRQLPFVVSSGGAMQFERDTDGWNLWVQDKATDGEDEGWTLVVLTPLEMYELHVRLTALVLRAGGAAV